MIANKKKISIIVLYLLPIFCIITALFLYSRTPENIPYMWNLKGQPTIFTKNAVVLFVIPVLSLMYSAYCHLLPYIDPKKDNYLKFEAVYYFMVMLITVLLTLIFIIYVINIFYPNLLPFIIAIKVFAALAILIIGNNLPKIKDNSFFGIINPWTRASHYVWYKTHRFAAKIYFIAGVMLLILAFINTTITNALGISLIITILIMPNIYSASKYYVKKDNSESNEDTKEKI